MRRREFFFVIKVANMPRIANIRDDVNLPNNEVQKYPCIYYKADPGHKEKRKKPCYKCLERSGQFDLPEGQTYQMTCANT